MRNLVLLAILAAFYLMSCAKDEYLVEQGPPVIELNLSAKQVGSKDSLEKAAFKKRRISFRNLCDTLFIKDSTAEAAYGHFKAHLAEARELGEAHSLGLNFSRAPAFRASLFKEPAKTDFLTKWVAEALESEDEELRALFAEMLNLLPVSFPRFHLENDKIRPGKEYRLYAWTGDGDKPEIVKFELARLSLYSNPAPRQFHTMVTDTIPYINYSHEYESRLDTPGIYRLTTSGETWFTQRYLQVSWLDMLVKTDGRKLLVWGASYKDTLAPPYIVHIQDGNQGYQKVATDSGGLAVLQRTYRDSATKKLKIILQKDSHLAFAPGVFVTEAGPIRRCHVFTDRPVYRPGDKVHIRGVLKKMVADRTLQNPEADSIYISVKDPGYVDIWEKSLPLDEWGHFGDSLVLPQEAKQGNYNIRYGRAKLKGEAKRVYIRGDYAGFIVEAYKKPEFVISLKATKDIYLTGEPVVVLAHGEYHFGGPLAHVPVKVRWHIQEMNHWVNQRARTADNSVKFYPGGGQILLKEETLKLNAQGNLKLKYAGKLDNAYNYLTVELIATDASRRQVRAEKRLKAVKHNLYLSILADRYHYNKGETVDLEILAVDLEGKRIGGRVDLRLKKDNEIVKETTLYLKREGKTSWTFTAEEYGVYIVEASIKDSHGKTVFAERRFRVQKSRHGYWKRDRMDIKADKQVYGPGDTARITVNAGADGARILLTAEGRELRGIRLTRLRGDTAHWRIPISDETGFNLHINAAYSGLKGLNLRSLQIRVIDSSILLQAKMSGPRQLKPGELFKGRIRITNSRGKPVRSAFSLALVDEAIFQVAEKSRYNNHSTYFMDDEKIIRGIMSIIPQYFSNRVKTERDKFSWEYYLSASKIPTIYAEFGVPILAESTSPSADDMYSMNAPISVEKRKRGIGGSSIGKLHADIGRSDKPPRERKDFKDLGYWVPSIVTDAKGEAQVAFTLPDDLTKWRLMAVGGDGGSHLLEFSDGITARQNIMVKLQAPRSFVAGDSAVISSVIHNYAESDITARVRFEIRRNPSHAALKGPGEKEIKVAKGATARADWPVVIKKPGPLSFYTSATAPSGGDAESREYPVLVHGVPMTLSHSGRLDAGNRSDSFQLTFPEKTDPDSKLLRLEFAPTMAWSLFQSLEYLTGYPYGCVEQTMSRFLPNLYVSFIMKKLGIKSDSLEKMLPLYTKKGLERLQRFQHADGGWGWWESDETNPRMTALVVGGLGFALKQKSVSSFHPEMRRMLQKGMESIHEQLSTKGLSAQDRAALLNALYRAGGLKNRAALKYLDALYAERGKLEPYGMALLLECLHGAGRASKKKRVLSLLTGQAHTTQRETWWRASSRLGWYSRDEETTARALRALSLVDPENKLIPGIIPWLSRKKRNGYWVSTKTTAAVIYALAEHMAKTGELNPAYSGAISLNGKEIKRFEVNRTGLKDWKGLIVLPNSGIADTNRIRFSMDGKGVLYYSADLKYSTAEEPIKAAGKALKLKRSYTRLVYRQDKKGEWQVGRVPFNGSLKGGDEVEVSISLTSAGDYENLLLEDYFPAGMEFLTKPKNWYDLWCGRWHWDFAHKEARDDRMVFFLNRIRPGKRTFSYLLRAETPGRFHTLPARAELMYNPEIRGHSGEMTVIIED